MNEICVTGLRSAPGTTRHLYQLIEGNRADTVESEISDNEMGGWQIDAGCERRGAHDTSAGSGEVACARFVTHGAWHPRVVRACSRLAAKRAEFLRQNCSEPVCGGSLVGEYQEGMIGVGENGARDLRDHVISNLFLFELYDRAGEWRPPDV